MKAKNKASAPTMEELDSRPGLKQIRERPLVEKSDGSDVKSDSKDDYI